MICQYLCVLLCVQFYVPCVCLAVGETSQGSPRTSGSDATECTQRIQETDKDLEQQYAEELREFISTAKLGDLGRKELRSSSGCLSEQEAKVASDVEWAIYSSPATLLRLADLWGPTLLEFPHEELRKDAQSVLSVLERRPFLRDLITAGENSLKGILELVIFGRIPVKTDSADKLKEQAHTAQNRRRLIDTCLYLQSKSDALRTFHRNGITPEVQDSFKLAGIRLFTQDEQNREITAILLEEIVAIFCPGAAFIAGQYIGSKATGPLTAQGFIDFVISSEQEFEELERNHERDAAIKRSEVPFTPDMDRFKWVKEMIGGALLAVMHPDDPNLLKEFGTDRMAAPVTEALEGDTQEIVRLVEFSDTHFGKGEPTDWQEAHLNRLQLALALDFLREALEK